VNQPLLTSAGHLAIEDRLRKEGPTEMVVVSAGDDYFADASKQWAVRMQADQKSSRRSFGSCFVAGGYQKISRPSGGGKSSSKLIAT
jgi:hypothetical protein